MQKTTQKLHLGVLSIVLLSSSTECYPEPITIDSVSGTERTNRMSNATEEEQELNKILAERDETMKRQRIIDEEKNTFDRIQKRHQEKTADNTSAMPRYSQPEFDPQAKSKQKEPGFFSRLSTKLSDFVIKQVNSVKDRIDSTYKTLKHHADVRNAKKTARAKAEGKILDEQAEQYFKKSMKDFTTKEKEQIANIWLRSHEMIYRKKLEMLKQQYQKINARSDMSEDIKAAGRTEIHQQIEANRKQLTDEVETFRADLASTLPTNEQIITLTDKDDKNFKSYEIIDMSKINPNEPIVDQLPTLFDNNVLSTHTSYEGKRARIMAEKLTDAYEKWQHNQKPEQLPLTIMHQQSTPQSITATTAIPENVVSALKVFGLNPNTPFTRSSIEKIYRQLALAYHPDKTNGPTITMQQLNAARDAITQYLEENKQDDTTRPRLVEGVGVHSTTSPKSSTQNSDTKTTGRLINLFQYFFPDTGEQK